MNDHKFIPFALPDVGEEELQEVAEAIRSGWITTGERTARFEKEFRIYAGARHSIALNSGTAGLHVALAALGIGPGDEVITTPMTFCATVNVILQVGATPVLVDIGPDLNIDCAAIAEAITHKTRAIMPVHIGGLPCEMDAIWQLARRHDLKVIEDAAHAADTFYKGAHVGSGPSDAVAFSFYATKNLTTGEGGMLTTQSADLAESMRILCLHGISRDAWNRYAEKGNWYYEVVAAGFKYNMSDILAAMGIHQLRKLERMNARRAEIAAIYNEAFHGMPELEIPPDRADCRHSWHLYLLRLNLSELEINRAQFFQEMRDRGIGCSVHFIPIPLHPYYKRTLEMRHSCRRAFDEYPRLLSLPLYSKMGDGEVHRVTEAVCDIVRSRRKPIFAAAGDALKLNGPFRPL